MIDLKLESQHDEGTRSGSTNLSKITPGGQLQKSGGGAALPDGAEPERLNIKNSVQTNGDSLDYDCGRGHKVARVCCPSAMLPLGSYPILRHTPIRRRHPVLFALPSTIAPHTRRPSRAPCY